MNLENYNDDLEKLILSCVLQRPSLLNESYLEPKHFLNVDNMKFYKFCQTFFKVNGNLDITLMSTKMNDKAKFIYYCGDIILLEPSPTLFYEYQSRQEEIYKSFTINSIIEKMNRKEIDYEEMIEQVNKINAEFLKLVDKNKLTPEEILELITTDKSNLTLVDFPSLQHKVNFLQNTVNVISARTSVGKSGLALNLFNDLSKNYKCIYFNMEMTEKEVYQRLIGINSGVPIESFKTPSPHQEELMKESAKEVYSKNIRIINGSKSIRALRNIIIKEQREEHLIVFVDYIGYVFTKENANDRERIGEAMRELQMLSKDYNITIFVLAQINRDGNDEPTLVNLKDSGELEQTAHTVLILHNPDKDLSNQTPELKLLIPKNRNGRTGYVKMQYNKSTQKFKEIITYS